jgi:hypothetical protein
VHIGWHVQTEESPCPTVDVPTNEPSGGGLSRMTFAEVALQDLSESLASSKNDSEDIALVE